MWRVQSAPPKPPYIYKESKLMRGTLSTESVKGTVSVYNSEFWGWIGFTFNFYLVFSIIHITFVLS